MKRLTARQRYSKTASWPDILIYGTCRSGLSP